VPGMCVHRVTRVLGATDAHRDPPHTTIGETLLDLVATAATFDEVCHWITTAFARSKVTKLQLCYDLSVRRTIRWRDFLLDLISSASAGDHSVLEYRYSRDVERGHRLPESVRQVPFTKPDGSDGRRDRVYERFGLVVELDGELAHPPEQTRRDKVRDRAAAAEGLLSIRYGWQDVDGNPCESAAEVGTILKTRGWTGTPRPCSPTCPVRSIPGSPPSGG
jgi:hypothetical protein